jgi:polysaccharide biosynthesis transport protein
MGVEEEIGTYLRVLWRRKWLIAACAIIALLVAAGISLRLTPIYAATATLRVASAPGGAADYFSMSSVTRLSNTYVDIATRDVTLDEVARRLGMQEQPDVEVEVVPETELIEITASDPNPVLASDVANTLANMMVEQSVQLYGGSAPTAREILEEQLKQAKADLDAAVSEYGSALRTARSPGTPEASDSLPADAAVEALARLVSAQQQIYSQLLQQYETARTNEELRSNAITVVEPAALPQKPATPKIPLNAALGFAAGLILGVILAFLLEAMDDTLRDIADVQAVTALPIFGGIPATKRAPDSRARLGLPRSEDLSRGLAFDQLRARLALLSAKSKATSFLITSPEPGAGKSFVATNLAMSFAKAGQRVVLLDMDFHRPRLHDILRLPNEKGVSDYMSGALPLDVVLQPTANPNLLVATAGSKLDDASAWLTQSAITKLLAYLSQESECVLIDAPALLSVADPALIACQADAVVLVVAQRATGRKQLVFALQQLAEIEARVAGVVMNKVPGSRLYKHYAKRRAKTEAGAAPASRGPSATRLPLGAPAQGGSPFRQEETAQRGG